MGLDMYLNRRIYIGGHWEHRKTTGKIEITSAGVKYTIDPKTVSEIILHEGQWRKANQIHAWFVDHCQGGVDDCRDAEVSDEQLKELLDLCRTALKTKNADLLKPREGFFFGVTDVDEYYWQDIENTIEILSKALERQKEDEKNKRYGSFFYHSSW